MNKDDIVGVYRTLGEDTVRADGTVVSDNARSAQIMYSPDGYMSVVSMPNGRKLLAKTSGGPDLNAATSEERAAAAEDEVRAAVSGQRVVPGKAIDEVTPVGADEREAHDRGEAAPRGGAARMSEYTATIEWQRAGAAFTDNRYSREHSWKFDGGIAVRIDQPL